MKPKGKCFAKDCEKCNWYQSWDLTETTTGLRKSEMRCSFQMLINEIPLMRGAVDGLQGGVNEARNRSMETQAVLKYIVDNKRGLLDEGT